MKLFGKLKNRNIKKRIFALFLTIFLVFAVCITAYADADTRGYSWYCKNNKDHTQPEIPAEFSFIGQYDGYSIDKNAKDEDKVIYLTFDAGYENGNVAIILDELKAHGATGAFFILGNLVERNTDLVVRMKEEGHLVCNHTFSHRDMTRVKSSTTFCAELKRLADYYYEKTGYELDKFYRPPRGCFTEDNLKHAKEAGYKTIFWSFAYADWDNTAQPDAEKAFEKVMAHTHNGAVILLHPTSATNAAIIGRLLDEWQKQGYRFGSLYELTGNAV